LLLNEKRRDGKDSYDTIVEKYKLSKCKEDALTYLDDDTLRVLAATSKEEIGQPSQNMQKQQLSTHMTTDLS
jgi:hypothetical protein